MSKSVFNLKSDWAPAGDQPEAISKLLTGLKKGMKKQTLLGVTGSGKTFTIANVIEKYGKPTLVIAHNKTLAAQLASEFKEFFPDHAVHYFVSYYDYYQPEAYLPGTDTYIEKDAQINEEIDRLRHASTQALLSRKDVIIVASVSCIYGLGSPEEYLKENLLISVGDKVSRTVFLKKLVAMHFTRTTADLKSGQFRALGSTIEIMPTGETEIYMLDIEGDVIKKITVIDPVSSKVTRVEDATTIFPAKHFLTRDDVRERAIKDIEKELKDQLVKFEKEGKVLEAERIKRRTRYDLAMIREIGYCSGIENYSRHLSGKKAGDPPETLLSYFPHKENGEADFLTVIDESHVTLPQLHGMYAGDASRKNTLVEHGFRLPSAKDNRPLRFEEFEPRIGQVVYTSATPGKIEREVSDQIVEQVIRPTGLIDPELIIKPVRAEGKYAGQVQDFIIEAEKEIKAGRRVLATTLTKKMAEDLSAYLKGINVKSEYLHSDIETLDRIRILTRFRKGEFDCLVGVNLLREGLDLPEVSLIGILDADKEGFLRSETSLIQTIGRAARNVLGRVILYADNMTGSLDRAIGETNRRRDIQIAYNKKHKITPQTIIKKIRDITEEMESQHEKAVNENVRLDLALIARGKGDKKTISKLIKQKEREMNEAVKELDFESAAILRDEIVALTKMVEGK
jgi:excinuclease ABC subunit B